MRQVTTSCFEANCEWLSSRSKNLPTALQNYNSESITLIIQPGGSIRDQEIINAADKAKIKMIFTGYRHFNH